MRITVILIIMLCCFTYLSTASAAEVPVDQIVLVVNADVQITEVDAGTVEKMYLGKENKLGKKKIEITTLDKGDLRDSFLKNYVKKSAAQFKTLWKKLVFSGKAKMPKDFKNEAEMVAYIAKTSGAVGYITVKTSEDSSIITDKVKVLKITTKK